MIFQEFYLVCLLGFVLIVAAASCRVFFEYRSVMGWKKSEPRGFTKIDNLGFELETDDDPYPCMGLSTKLSFEDLDKSTLSNTTEGVCISSSNSSEKKSGSSMDAICHPGALKE